MILQPRQLPKTRIHPEPNESFASYVDRLAATLPVRLPVITVLFRTGVTETEEVKSIGHAYGIALTTEQLENFAHATRLSTSRAHALLLQSYDGRVLDLTGLNPQVPESARIVASREWAYFLGSHFCPGCLEENQAWLLPWKLPWTFACNRHECLLVDTCPCCMRRPGNFRPETGGAPRFASSTPLPGHCMNPRAVGQAQRGRASIPCQYPLSNAHTLKLTEHSRLLYTQERINDLLNQKETSVAGQSVPIIQYFKYLRSVCAMILYAATPEDLGELPLAIYQVFERHVGDRIDALEERKRIREKTARRGGPAPAAFRGAPQSASLMASILPTATHILDAKNPVDLQSRIHWLVERVHSRKQNAVRNAVDDYNLTGVLLDAFDKCLSPAAKFDRRHGMQSARAQLQGYNFTAEHIPQLLWEEDYETYFKPLLITSDITDNYARRALSVILLRLSTPKDWTSLALDLELPASTGKGIVNKLNTVISGLGNTDAYDQALHSLAKRLSNSQNRVNYALRRLQLKDFFEIEISDWKSIAENAGFHRPGYPARRRNAAAWVWGQVTGGDPHLSPALSGPQSNNLKEVYRRFIKDDLPLLRSSLLDYSSNLVLNRLTTGLVL